jgi:pyruvate/2-oxoglutarate/acetoin dehydrogenase E1 component
MFEHATLYPTKGELADGAGPVDLDSARVLRAGTDVTIIGWGGTLHKALTAAEHLAEQGVDAEVIDLRSLRPIDDATIMESITRTNRAVVVDEGWRSGGLSAELAARIAEQAFYHLDAPVERVCSAEVPIPYAKHLEDAALPQVDEVVAAAERVLGR